MNIDVNAELIEARAHLDGIAALLAAGEGEIQITSHQLQMLLQPARERLARIEKAMSKSPAVRVVG